MAQSRLHKVDRAASVEGVAGVGVSEPVGADPRPYPGPPSRRSDYAEDLRGVQMAALAGAEDGSVGVGTVTQARKFLPRCGRQQYHPSLLALAADGDLPCILPLLSVAPHQRAQFGDSESPSVEEAQQNSVPAMRLEGEQAVNVGLRQDALGQAILLTGQPQRPAHIKSQIAKSVAKGQEGLHCRQGATSAGRGEAQQGVRKALNVGERDLVQRFVHEVQEPLYVAPIGPLRMRTAAVQPQRHQLSIGAGLADGRVLTGSRKRRCPFRMHDKVTYHAFMIQEIMVVDKKLVSYDAGRRDERVKDQLLTPAQVGERLQVTERTVYQWLRDGQLVGHKLGRLWRIRPEDLEAFLDRTRVSAGEGWETSHK